MGGRGDRRGSDRQEEEGEGRWRHIVVGRDRE